MVTSPLFKEIECCGPIAFTRLLCTNREHNTPISWTKGCKLDQSAVARADSALGAGMIYLPFIPYGDRLHGACSRKGQCCPSPRGRMLLSVEVKCKTKGQGCNQKLQHWVSRSCNAGRMRCNIHTNRGKGVPRGACGH